MDAKVFLFDIEGTTTPIEFVHKVLFPYSTKRFHSYFVSPGIEPELAEELIRASQNEPDYAKPVQNNPNSLADFCEFLVTKDRKLGALKEVQGRIWKSGYESGELKSTIFSDVPHFLEVLKKNGKRLAVYSSGSTEAQVLIYKYCEAGDLTKYFERYFDTSVGGKRESESYLKIAEQMLVSPGEIAFFTDIKEEADAAQKAGILPYILDRPGNKPQPEHTYPILKTFDNLVAENFP
ncbi:acireductone synthase [Leptospira perolatii]|uniref:Acireductone synthase n=1 Tax=Leptospira perolatii TaxID=2023191 RepID=A0A2M9ZP63_9LEPT|nr:acireductone synthase [Leptospira perolatii]PJZ69706.1 acireductone synthase [Leptospira perolatii]PJZ73713.1 acireductone synthase [Leptospira perolatii]